MLHYCFTAQSLLSEDKPCISGEVMCSSVSIGQRIFTHQAEPSLFMFLLYVPSFCVHVLRWSVFICSRTLGVLVSLWMLSTYVFVSDLWECWNCDDDVLHKPCVRVCSRLLFHSYARCKVVHFSTLWLSAAAWPAPPPHSATQPFMLWPELDVTRAKT